MTGRFPPGVDVPEAFFNLQNEVGPEGLFNLQNDEVGDESGCRMLGMQRSSGEDRWRFASGALPGLLLPPPPLSTQAATASSVHTAHHNSPGSGAHTASPHRPGSGACATQPTRTAPAAEAHTTSPHSPGSRAGATQPTMTAVAVEEPSAHDAEPCQLTSKQSPAHRKRIQAAMAVEIAGHDAEPEGLHRLHPGARSQERGPSIAGHNAEPEGLHRLQPEARSQESGHQSLDSLTTVSSFEILDPDT